MSLEAFMHELTRLHIVDKYHAVLLEVANGEVERLKTIEPEDFMGKVDAEGWEVTAPAARELVRHFRAPAEPFSPEIMHNLKRSNFDAAKYKEQFFHKDWQPASWPSIKKSAEFEAKFEQFFKEHALNGDGNIDGAEVPGFMDQLADLLAEHYGTWKTVEELRLAIQWNLDRDFDGEITRAEADEFLEMVRTGHEEVINVRLFGVTEVPQPKATAQNDFFENEFHRLWTKYDADGSGTIEGAETAVFLDGLTDLVIQAYAPKETRAELRAEIQQDLDGNHNGNVTRAEAEAFIFRRAAAAAAGSGFREEQAPPKTEVVNVPHHSGTQLKATSQNEFFETEFQKLWAKYDADGSGTIEGAETAVFLDGLTDLVIQAYAPKETRAELRDEIQNDLDGDHNGNVTKKEAEAFIFRRCAGRAFH